MRALPENIARGQSNDRACEVVADQGQYKNHACMIDDGQYRLV